MYNLCLQTISPFRGTSSALLGDRKSVITKRQKENAPMPRFRAISFWRIPSVIILSISLSRALNGSEIAEVAIESNVRLIINAVWSERTCHWTSYRLPSEHSWAFLALRVYCGGTASRTRNRRGVRHVWSRPSRRRYPIDSAGRQTDQSGSNLSSRPAESASRKMNSGRAPRPAPAIRADIIASPLFTRSGPDGRTVADLPSLVKRQVSATVMHGCRDAAVLREVEWMSRSAMLLQVGG